MQVDWWDRESWFVQDHATGTVRGYTDAHGEMVHQYRFDAFGNLRGVDTFPLASSGGLFNSFRNRLGHQGLFAERVDHHTNALTLHPSGELWYQNRSRWYAPELGRFLSSDPNATGVPTMSSLAMLGKTPMGPPSGSFEWSSQYGDGWDTFTAYGANPVMHQDPNGLFFGYAAMGVGTGLSFGLGALGDLGDIEQAYNTSAQLGGSISVYNIQHQLLLEFIDSMFDPDGGQSQQATLQAYNQASSSLNYVNANGGFSYAAGSVWAFPPFVRGREIEKRLGQNLHPNFPGIDSFDRTRGDAISIKSIDTNAKSYDRDSSIRSRVRNYIRDHERFNGGKLGIHEVKSSDIKIKTLKIGIPQNAVERSFLAIKSQEGYARSRGIRIRVIRIP